MDTETLKELMREVVQEEMQKNQWSGVSQIPTHSHDGVDNLQISPLNFLGYPIYSVTSATVAPTAIATSGTLRFQFDGTNFTLWVMNGTTWKQVGGSAGASLEVKEVDGSPDVSSVTIIRVSNGTLTNDGGGQVTINNAGTPGGSTTQVQFNSAGAFAGNSGFTFASSGSTRTMVLGNTGSAGGGVSSGGIIDGGNSDFTIKTDNKSGASSQVADIYVNAGTNTGSSYAQAGTVWVLAGDGTGITGDHNSSGGNVKIYAGESRGSGNIGGIVELRGGSSIGNTDPGGIILNASFVGGANGNLGNLFINPSSSIGSQINDVLATGATGALILYDSATPSTQLAGGGILYSSAGALNYMGSSGTVTPIAPA